MALFRPDKNDVRTTRSALKEARQPEKDSGAVDKLVRRLLTFGIEGIGKLDSAKEIADAAAEDKGSAQKAVDQIIKHHVRLARGGGFLTGVGGIATLALALPANVLTFYTVATRMVAAIAEVRGYDTDDEHVRSAVLVTLTGDRSEKLVTNFGLGPIGSRLSSAAASKLPSTTLMLVNKAIGVHLLRSVGKRGLTKIFRGVPLLGGFVGQALDARHMKRIAEAADRQFPASK